MECYTPQRISSEILQYQWKLQTVLNLFPRSHHKIMELAKSDVEKYEYIISLNRDLSALDLGEAVELTPRRGDVLSFTYMFWS